MNQEQVEQLRKLYPKGTRIQIHEMKDDYRPVPRGTYGTVKSVDDAGTIHMSWDNGQGLGIVAGEDDFTVVARPDKLPEEIKVLIVEPDQHPRIETIKNEYETMNKIVGGLIEEIHLDDYTVLICNEEGKLRGLQPNRQVGQDVIVGTFFIASDQGMEELVSLQEDQIEKYTKRFYEIEDHSLQEVLESMGIRILM